MVVLPAMIAVSRPPAVIPAMPGLLLDQAPPEARSPKISDEPAQGPEPPVIGANGYTVTIVLVEQPPDV